MATTQKDVALRAGVSQPTVAGVLRGDPRVAAATKQRVLDAIRDLNFRPHAAARDLAFRRSIEDENSAAGNARAVEIDLWWNSHHTAFRDDLFNSEQQAFRELYPEISVNVVENSGMSTEEFFDRLFIALATGASPHCHYLPHVQFQRFVKLGLCADLTPFVEAWPQADRFAPSTWDVVRYGEKYFGMPTAMASIQFLHLNRELCAAAGLKGVPQTWDETIEWAKRLTNREENRYGLSLPPLDNDLPYFFVDLIYQHGGRLVRPAPDGWELALDEKPVLEAMRLVQELRWKFKVIPPQIAQTLQEQRDDFLRGRVAMAVSDPIIEHGVGDHLSPAEFDLVPLPMATGHAPFCQLGIGVWIVNAQANPAQQRAAWKYLQFISSREALLLASAAYQRHGQVYAPTPTLLDFPETEAMRATLPASWQKAMLEAEKNARFVNYPLGRELKTLRRILLRVLTDPAADVRLELKRHTQESH